jgi:hypothetical protein
LAETELTAQTFFITKTINLTPATMLGGSAMLFGGN